MVFWLLGLAGSGKTTLGKMAFAYLQEQNIKSYLIDGDEVRKFFDNDLGYSKKEREENIKRIIFAASALSDVGVHVVVCNISPFEELRTFARNKIKGYRQVYLAAGIDSVSKVESKSFYASSDGKVVGVNIEFEIPRQNDLEISTHDVSESDSFILLKEFIDQELNL